MDRVDRRIVGVLLLLAVIGVVDAVTPDIVLSPFTVVPVLVASTFATARQTAWIAGLAVVTTLLLGFPDEEFGTADHIVRAATVAMVAGFSIYVARSRHERESTLRRDALHDPLTGLANRALLVDRLRQQMLRREPPGSLAVFFVDLDSFKSINDTYGHSAGDEVLKHAARCLQTVTRAEDTLARYGGDEFVLLCPDVPGPSGASSIAERMGKALATPPPADGLRSLEVTASIGVAIGDSRNLDETTFMQAADQAMMDTKRRRDHGYTVRSI